MASIGWFDWFFLALALVSVALGAWRGLVYEVIALLGWVAAFFLAQAYALVGASWLPMTGMSEPLRYAAGFVLIFVGTLMLGGLVAVVAQKLLSAVGLRPIDRALGALFGALRAVILGIVIALALGLTPLKNEAWWQESHALRALDAAAVWLTPFVPDALREKLPGFERGVHTPKPA
jgi:membrane protein required for colicin V production